jgi:hypothetical protein
MDDLTKGLPIPPPCFAGQNEGWPRANEGIRALTAIEIQQQRLRKLNESLAQVNDIWVMATDACFDCAQACRACAQACLGEKTLHELRNCIQMNLDCADVCFATGDLAIRRVLRKRCLEIQEAGFDERIMELMFETCSEVCFRCAEECMRHAEYHKHCRKCADVCRCCAQACLNAARPPKLH